MFRGIASSVVCVVVSCLSVTSSADDLKLGHPPRALTGRVLPYGTPVPVTFSIANRGTVDEDVLVTTFFEEAPDRQYGRRMWLPPNSARTDWFLLTTPPGTNAGEEVEAPTAQTLVLRQSAAGEAAVPTVDGKRSMDHFVRCAKTASPVLLMMDIEDEEPMHLAGAASLLGASQGRFEMFWDEPFPPTAEAFDGYAHVILATRRLADDAAGLAALRQWVFNGGRLWIMLDRTGVELPASLLDDEGLAGVDTVGLSEIRMDAAAGVSLSRPEELRSFEQPISMVRVVGPGYQELIRQNGWPAALLRPYGDGQVFITTVGPRGWYRIPGPLDRDLPQNDLVKFAPTEACSAVAQMFFVSDENAPQPASDWSALAARHVGYRVTSRGTVAFLLGGYCLLVLGGGAWLLSRDRLGRMLWFAPAAAGCAALTLAAIGHAARTGVPPTEAALQLVEVDETGRAMVGGVMSVYDTNAGRAEVTIVEQGHVNWRESPPGSVKRLVFRDDGSRRWENLELLAGIHELDVKVPRNLEPSLAALSLDERGIVGSLKGHAWKETVSGVLALPTGRLSAVRFGAGELRAGSADTLAPGQYLSQELLGDRERIQADAYRELLVGPRRLPSEPRLYFWTEPFDLEVALIDEGRRAGDALVSLPARWVPPPTGAKVLLPPGLIRLESVVNDTGGVSTIYGNRTRTWTESISNESYTTLECHVPPELGELTVVSARGVLDMHAANRTVRLFVVDDSGTKRELGSWTSPAGRYDWTVESPLPAKPSPSGRFLKFVVHVGPFQGEDENDPNKASWRIEDLILEADGVAGP